MIKILACVEVPDASAYADDPQPSGYRAYRVVGMVGSQSFSVLVEDGQCEYEQYPTSLEDDEPLQVAIGEYMEAHNLPTGIIHR